MKSQQPLVAKGTRMTTSGHALTVTEIRRDGIGRIMEDGRPVTVDFRAVERAVKDRPFNSKGKDR